MGPLAAPGGLTDAGPTRRRDVQELHHPRSHEEHINRDSDARGACV
eukprot:COSAG06_NODE_1307_length_9916_cov_99.462361_4_plen_46_part_00